MYSISDIFYGQYVERDVDRIESDVIYFSCACNERVSLQSTRGSTPVA